VVNHVAPVVGVNALVRALRVVEPFRGNGCLIIHIMMEDDNMSRNEDSTQLRKGLGDIKAVSTEREYASRKLDVMVLSKDITIFESWVNEQFELIDLRWTSYKSTTLPITSEEFLRYAYTAVRTRVARTRGDKFHIRCDAEWQLPTGIAAVLAQLGRIIADEGTTVTILPLWNSEHDDKLLSVEEFLSISTRLRNIAREPSCKFVFAEAIAGDRKGDPVLMNLIPVRDSLGRIIRVRGHKDFDAIAGVSYLLLDLDPEGLDGHALEQMTDDGLSAAHILMVPPFFLRRAIVMQYLTRYSEISVG
jgi:hypothetical protein